MNSHSSCFRQATAGATGYVTVWDIIVLKSWILQERPHIKVLPHLYTESRALARLGSNSRLHFNKFNRSPVGGEVWWPIYR